MAKQAFRFQRALGALAIIAATGGLGCASKVVPPPIVTSADLGQVIIYRNGVAYFERYAPPTEKEVTLRVPAERVDDFLKSLSVVDAKSGETMPVSYPTVQTDSGVAKMTIKLPDRHNGLRITYVTESPAWKPSYRLVLDDQGKAKLMAWAIVDNVSGEDWDKVKVGVGSTSALSFRYDLHTIRQVRRETLESGSLLAVAPPTGGSPHLVKKPAERVVMNVGQSALDELALDDKRKKAETLARNEPQPDMVADGLRNGYGGGLGVSGGAGGTRASRVRTGAGKAASGRYRPRAPRPAAEPPPAQMRRPRRTSSSQRMVQRLSRKLQRGQHRVVVEGYARKGDRDARQASLERANVLREQLIANGVPADRIDAIGTGEINTRQGARIVTVTDQANKDVSKSPAKSKVTAPTTPSVDEAAETQPLGQAHFVSAEPMTIKSEHSAMVSILNDAAAAERIYYYDPISSRGSKDYAFNAIKLTNPTKYTLDSGPITVYKKGQFLGEGLSEAILPGSSAFIPYALDRAIIVEPESSTREEIDQLITIQRGIVTTKTKHIRKTKLTLVNRSKDDARVYVRHKVRAGYTLENAGKRVEKLGGAHLFPVDIQAGQTLDLIIEESTPTRSTIDIRTDNGVKAIALYLRKANLDPELKKNLDEVVRRHSARADLEERIRTMVEQEQVYRQRIDELNFQLVTLRKVKQAAKLRRHLSDKMEEISDKLQDSTLKISELKGELMTSRIELQDALAELTLRKQDEETSK